MWIDMVRQMAQDAALKYNQRNGRVEPVDPIAEAAEAEEKRKRRGSAVIGRGETAVQAEVPLVVAQAATAGDCAKFAASRINEKCKGFTLIYFFFDF